jgi:hypothetical protein
MRHMDGNALSRLVWAFARCGGAFAPKVIPIISDIMISRGVHTWRPHVLGRMAWVYAAHPGLFDASMVVLGPGIREEDDDHGADTSEKTRLDETDTDMSGTDMDMGKTDSRREANERVDNHEDFDHDMTDSGRTDSGRTDAGPRQAHRDRGHGRADKKQRMRQKHDTSVQNVVNQTLSHALMDRTVDLLEKLSLARLREIGAMLLACGLTRGEESEKAMSILDFVNSEANSPENVRAELEEVENERSAARETVWVNVCVFVCICICLWYACMYVCM